MVHAGCEAFKKHATGRFNVSTNTIVNALPRSFDDCIDLPGVGRDLTLFSSVFRVAVSFDEEEGIGWRFSDGSGEVLETFFRVRMFFTFSSGHFGVQLF